MKFKDHELGWKDQDGDRLLVSIVGGDVIFRTLPPGDHEEPGYVSMKPKNARKFALALLAELGDED